MPLYNSEAAFCQSSWEGKPLHPTHKVWLCSHRGLYWADLKQGRPFDDKAGSHSTIAGFPGLALQPSQLVLGPAIRLWLHPPSCLGSFLPRNLSLCLGSCEGILLIIQDLHGTGT